MNNTFLLEKFRIYGISPEDYPMEKYSDRTDEDLRSSARAITRRLDDLHMDAAIITGVLPLQPGKKFWTLDEINWDDPKLQKTDIEKQCKELAQKRYELTNVVNLRKAIKEDNVISLLAKDKAYTWGAKHSLEELVTFFEQNNLHLGFGSLIPILEQNPHYLDEEGVL
ncbi:MAG: hypothetical protein IJF83_00105 [Methanobrevibacter sp.]|nr:hypothetical protein [Methanobrevibacter sp.]